MKSEKKKMQSVSFRNVGEMLAYLPEDQLEITVRLRDLVLECLPGAKEKLSFNVPFYFLHKNVCHIWPGAIPWGKKTTEGVSLGLSYGYLLNDPSEYLERGTRKYIFTKKFHRLEDVDEEIVRHFLLESVEIDEMVYMEKERNRKKKTR